MNKKWLVGCLLSVSLGVQAAGVTLTVAAFPAVDEIVKAAAVEWERQSPGVTVKVISRAYADHHTAMTTALATSSDLPDVMTIEYGYFEVRAKLPCTLGTWPAIWMLGDHALPQEPNWPLDGEIDIMEQKGFNSTEKGVVSAALHFSDQHGSNPIFNDRSVPSACTGFNTYHLTWTTDAIKIGVNGVNYLTYNKPANPTQQNWPYDAPQYLLLNLAIGGNLGGTTIGTMPDQMEVDYVRVWQPPS